ncbi:MAG: hypothetical protein MUC77_20345 [Chromatiaceae bacterium]|jgi:hypothetical protein|nr:hypothetical protein [Chromatiaceae bacterium]
MPTSVTDQLAAVIAPIDERGNADQWRLTTLNGWCGRPGRLTALALSLWVAARAAVHGRASAAPVSEFLGKAQVLLRQGETTGRLDPIAAERLHPWLEAFQSTDARGNWGPVRVVTNPNSSLTVSF